MDNCENCIYWHKRILNSTCRRTPDYHIHGASDWCGEFKAIEQIAQPVAPLPRLEPMSKSLEALLLPEIIEVSEPVKPQRARKKNVPSL